VSVTMVLALALASWGWGGATAPLRSSEPRRDDGSRVLVPGDPPLTQAIVDGSVGVWNAFFEITINQEQHDALQRALIQAWQRHQERTIHDTLDDFKLHGKEGDIPALRLANQSLAVDALRKRSDYELGRLILEIYDAAHPERRDFMATHAMGDLVGEWKRVDFNVPETNPTTHAVIGISFTDTLILSIFADGHFKHFWVHGHCGRGHTCCRKYSTDARGTVRVEGQSMALKAETGTQIFDDPCTPATNTSGPMALREERLGWSLKRGANSGVTLCLGSQPFDPWQQGPAKPVCYTRQ
jgi:hypothetical protein